MPEVASSTTTPWLSSSNWATSRVTALSSTSSTRRPRIVRCSTGTTAAWAACRAASLALGRGATKEKVLPWPNVLHTESCPPIWATRARLMLRPRPVPPKCRVVSAYAWVNS